ISRPCPESPVPTLEFALDAGGRAGLILKHGAGDNREAWARCAQLLADRAPTLRWLPLQIFSSGRASSRATRSARSDRRARSPAAGIARSRHPVRAVRASARQKAAAGPAEAAGPGEGGSRQRDRGGCRSLL